MWEYVEECCVYVEECCVYVEWMCIEVECVCDVICQCVGDNVSICVIEDDDGNCCVWVNGEEQIGDDLIDWFNEFEVDCFEGGN